MNMNDLTVNRQLDWIPDLSDSATATDNTECMMKTNVSTCSMITVYCIISFFLTGWYSVL